MASRGGSGGGTFIGVRRAVIDNLLFGGPGFGHSSVYGTAKLSHGVIVRLVRRFTSLAPDSCVAELELRCSIGLVGRRPR